MNLIFGSMNLGPQINLGQGKEMISRFISEGYTEIDTAYVYNEGETEKMLGEILALDLFQDLTIATKVNPRITGKLDRDAIEMQLNESLKRMRLDKVDILYLHMPDANTPIEDTLGACAALFKEGKFKELGLSNFPSWMVADIWHLCDKNGWPKPSVYQGLYNGVSRKTENELFPCLERFGIRFYAFNPLAGGLLTGKQLEYEADPNPGRFARLASYRKRYWKKSFFDSINLINDKCKDLGIKPAGAALRWLAFHSQMNAERGDGIIIGASNINQLSENIRSINEGPLPKELLVIIDQAWNISQTDCPDYFYFYGK